MCYNLVMAKLADQTLLTWEAQEYIQREKNIGWYICLILVGLAFGALAFFYQSWTFLVLIILSVIALIIYSARPPRMIKYSLTNKGVMIGQRLHEYSSLKAFGVVQENQHYSIVFLPRKRFAIRQTIFFPQEKGEKIVDLIGARLPMQEIKPDILDQLVKFLRI